MSGSVVSLDSIVDRVIAMKIQEDGPYNYKSYLLEGDDTPLNVTWREKITHWSYNVVDHFDLSREVVAISLDLFDRFLATRGNKCNGNLALLTSLTTLHLAIKLHDNKKIRMATLANLSRGQFGPSHIEEMEWVVLSALQWKVHPPTAYSFIFHLLLFLPQEANQSVRTELFELSRYLAELAACDSLLVSYKKSAVAFAAILNVMEDISYKHLSAGIREKFLRDLSEKLHLNYSDPEVVHARHRISSMIATNLTESSPTLESKLADDVVSVSSNESGCSLSRSVDSGSCRRIRTNSVDSKGSRGSRGSYRYSASPRARRVAVSPIGRARIASNPMVANIQ